MNLWPSWKILSSYPRQWISLVWLLIYLSGFPRLPSDASHEWNCQGREPHFTQFFVASWSRPQTRNLQDAMQSSFCGPVKVPWAARILRIVFIPAANAEACPLAMGLPEVGVSFCLFSICSLPHMFHRDSSLGLEVQLSHWNLESDFRWQMTLGDIVSLLDIFEYFKGVFLLWDLCFNKLGDP